MAIPRVKQPPGSVRAGAYGSVQMRWNPAFGSRWTIKFSDVQATMAELVLDYCEPFIPKDTGNLIAHGHVTPNLNVSWNVPYARYQYFSPKNRIGAHNGPLRGPFWFDRMKAVYMPNIVRNAKRRVKKTL